MACGNLFAGAVQDLPYCLANILKIRKQTRILKVKVIVETERVFIEDGDKTLWGKRLCDIERRIEFRVVSYP